MGLVFPGWIDPSGIWEGQEGASSVLKQGLVFSGVEGSRLWKGQRENPHLWKNREYSPRWMRLDEAGASFPTGSAHSRPSQGREFPGAFRGSSHQPLDSQGIKSREKSERSGHRARAPGFVSRGFRRSLSAPMSWEPPDGPGAAPGISLESGGCQGSFALGKRIRLPAFPVIPVYPSPAGSRLRLRGEVVQPGLKFPLGRGGNEGIF